MLFLILALNYLTSQTFRVFGALSQLSLRQRHSSSASAPDSCGPHLTESMDSTINLQEVVSSPDYRVFVLHITDRNEVMSCAARQMFHFFHDILRGTPCEKNARFVIYYLDTSLVTTLNDEELFVTALRDIIVVEKYLIIIRSECNALQFHRDGIHTPLFHLIPSYR